MKTIWTLAGIGVLSLTLGMPALSRAQDEEKPRQEEPKAEPKAEPKQQQNEMKPPKQNDAKPAKSADQQKTESEPQSGQKTAQPASGRSGHIPDDKFRANFGRQHTVVIRQPVMVGGQPRFQFGGYWFVISDPWPAGWLYTDDCYIDYVDGEYVLFDLLHPGVSIALVVVM
jgi:hypothetical protein